MSSTSIYQGTDGRIINRMHTMNDDQCSYGTGLIKMEDSFLCNRPYNVSGLLGAIPHEVLCPLTLIAGVVQTIAGPVTMISPAMSIGLDRLNRFSRR